MFNFIVLLMLCWGTIDVHAGNYKELYDKLPDAVKPMVDELHKTCMQESGANENGWAGLSNGEFPDDDSLKKYIHCYWKNLGVIDDGGQFDGESFIDLLSPDHAEYAKKVVSKCVFKFGDTENEKLDGLYKTVKCGHDVSPAEFAQF